ncbi:MAG: DNA-binding transcriptional regulator GbsR (MarR family) [Kiritimatiellia bacterium]|jgi:DNA-binding transcriptional regulator GbsR (MarR family)
MNAETPTTTNEQLQQAKDDFITQWGVIGNAWGISRTMAQIHALLMVSPEPLSTDQIMEELQISRGNAHSNLRELVSWGVVKSVIKKGERKEFFESEKDVWKMFCTITRERKRREIDPALNVLIDCVHTTSEMDGQDAQDFHQQLVELCEFVQLASGVMDKIASAEESKALPIALNWLKNRKLNKVSEVD